MQRKRLLMARYQTDQAGKIENGLPPIFSVDSFCIEWALAFPVVAKSCQIYEHN